MGPYSPGHMYWTIVRPSNQSSNRVYTPATQGIIRPKRSDTQKQRISSAIDIRRENASLIQPIYPQSEGLKKTIDLSIVLVLHQIPLTELVLLYGIFLSFRDKRCFFQISIHAMSQLIMIFLKTGVTLKGS